MLFLAVTTLALAGLGQAAPSDGSRYLWYSSPGTDFNSGLPIGNGRVAGLVYGSAVEKISLNENSIWSGSFMNRLNSKSGPSAVNSIRSQLANGQLTAAGSATLANLDGNPTSPRQYQPLGSMSVDFGHSQNSWSGYYRWLDTAQGNAGVTYTYGGVNYTREYIASYPHGVLAFRFQSGTAGKLNAKISLSRTSGVNSQTASSSGGTNVVNLVGGGGGITFSSQARIIADSGSVTNDGKSVSVTGATTVDVIFDAETTYRYSSQSSAETELASKISKAAADGYDKIKSVGLADSTALLSRVTLNLGTSSGTAATQATSSRISAYKNNPNNDVQFATLMFNYGRHLLVASSRKTHPTLSLPANLQGIWDEDFNPPWQSKYTVNINTEMNYWPAEVTNLAETHEALYDLIDIIRARGAVAAQQMYGCGGWVSHHNVDLWGDPAPVDSGTTYSVWPMSPAWLASHVMEHYRYSGNATFLANRAWPILKDTATFYLCYMYNYNGHMETGPSLSPENGFVIPSGMSTAGQTTGTDIGPTMDLELLWGLFNDVIAACKVLGSTDSVCTQAPTQLSKIRQPPISSSGRIQEWRGDYGETDVGHRHLSPLWGLYPGYQMTPLVNQTLATASLGLLNRRVSGGSGSTGWSRVWIMNCFARLLDGNNLWTHTQAFLKTYPLANMWNSNSGPPFQIDGNFGFVSGLAEGLLQSHVNGLVHILPALPSAIATGSYTGLVARGNFIVGASWSGGKLVAANVTSNIGGQLALRVQSGASIKVNGNAYSSPIATTAGQTYTVTLA